MTWGRVPADVAGNVIARSLGSRFLYWVSLDRLTIVWEGRP